MMSSGSGTTTGRKPDSGVRLYIGGFPRRTTKSELEEFCSRYGKLKGDIDLIPNKQFAFVTFASKEEANLAMFAIQQELFKGSRLHVDWAKRRKDQEEKDPGSKAGNAPAGAAAAQPLVSSKNPADHSAKQQPISAGGSSKDSKESKDAKYTNNVPRYIPGDTKETIVITSHPQPQSAAIPESSGLAGSDEVVDFTEPPDMSPQQLLSFPSIPNLISRVHYPESNPPLELTIRDTQSHDIKYIFRIKSLSSLKHYLLQEAAGEVSGPELFHTSSLKKDNEKNLILYGGLPVVHIYQDLLGKEVLEPKENKDDREIFVKRKDYKYLEIPPPKVPIAQKRIPIEEIYHLLVSKSYENVIINTSANGQSAPLHPEWKPLPYTYAFRKGNQLVMLYGNTIVESFQFLLQSTNQSYRDLLPILLKYGLCIFNSTKGAFITPAQLQ